jgi:hypothetical protein
VRRASSIGVAGQPAAINVDVVRIRAAAMAALTTPSAGSSRGGENRRVRAEASDLLLVVIACAVAFFRMALVRVSFSRCGLSNHLGPARFEGPQNSRPTSGNGRCQVDLRPDEPTVAPPAERACGSLS